MIKDANLEFILVLLATRDIPSQIMEFVLTLNVQPITSQLASDASMNTN